MVTPTGPIPDSELPPSKGQNLMHWSAVILAAIAGLWFAVNEPATIVFERSARALNITGPILIPTSLLFAAAATLLSLVVVYGVAYGAIRVIVGRVG